MNEVEETNYSSNIIQESENQSKTVDSEAEISDEKEAEISDEKKEENIESSSSNGLENFDFNENETLESFNSDGVTK